MTKRTHVLKDAVVPFTFKRGQCFLCEAPAVARIADEPVCPVHERLIRQIQRDGARESAA